MPLGPIDKSLDRTATLQLADRLRELVEAGEVGPGEKLPSERVLMETYGLARGTVRDAVDVLKAEGLVESEHGRGTIVRRKPPVKRVAHDRFARRHRKAGQAAFLVEMAADGRTPEVEVRHVGQGTPPAHVAERLGITTATKVLARERRYLADGYPMELATSYVPWTLAKGTAMTKPNPGPGGIYARIEEVGHKLGRFAEDVTARMPSPEEAQLLRLGPGVPVIIVVRTAFDTDGLAVEVCDTVMAADRYELSYELPAR